MMGEPQGKRGQLKRTRARNLQERLRGYKAEVLRFLDDPAVPLTNNIRLLKAQQKISGFFRSIEGAQIFCRLHSYLSTTRKQDMSGSEALAELFEGRVPTFMRGAGDNV